MQPKEGNCGGPKSTKGHHDLHHRKIDGTEGVRRKLSIRGEQNIGVA